jgi:hypothetical protein
MYQKKRILPHFIDNHVVKGDQQKSDNAVVPDQLWTFAFFCGYGPEGHGG